MTRYEQLIVGLPDPEGARRFLNQLVERNPADAEKLTKNEGLLSDVLTLVSFSPLLAATLLQNPEYLWWINRKRRESGVRGKEELLESMARFKLANSGLKPQVLFARFRRRELLRIFLRDIRRLGTIAEITEEISNLADAVLEAALEEARREIDTRYGSPQESDESGTRFPARFCIAAFGKLGSLELNYSSDIDLLFLYSAEGTTSGLGYRGAVSNREYFIKLSELLVKLVGEQSGEGAAYRVDMRLRPHGSLGALTLSVRETVNYFKSTARAWERQVLIRSRGCAGDIELFKEFFSQVEDLVFVKDQTVETALASVRKSKERIDKENIHKKGYDVKIGRGGVREIEFLAQALQLAYGGADRWLRSPHTLISLTRLADRRHISETELTELFAAYEFLRRTEHILQMKNGVQTHIVPDDPEKRAELAAKMNFTTGGSFERDLADQTETVNRIFRRVFGETAVVQEEIETRNVRQSRERSYAHLLASLQKSDLNFQPDKRALAVIERITTDSPHFSAMLAANPQLFVELPDPEAEFSEPDYSGLMLEAVEKERDFGRRLSAMRKTWSRFLFEIAVRDIFETLPIRTVKRLQTNLAEACITAAIRVVRDEIAEKYRIQPRPLDLAVFALGKLGGRSLDYDSDLDVLMVYFDPQRNIGDVTPVEFYGRVVEMFTTAISSMTRDGNLYRVDLRLRPFGSKGLTAISIDAFISYMKTTAAIWELLAFVKLRAVGGDRSLGFSVENEIREIIHNRARGIDADELRAETNRVRKALEENNSLARRTGEVDIKFGAGGLLDVYFATRFLQLRDNIPDDQKNRSTVFMLERLKESGSISSELHADFADGYDFLSMLDHNLRLTVGRSTAVPVANRDVLNTIAKRMELADGSDLLEQLTLRRLTVRAAFDSIMS